MIKPYTSLPYFEPIGRKSYIKKWVKHRKAFADKLIVSNDSSNRFDDWYEKGIELLEINNLELAYVFRYVVEAAGCQPFYNQIFRLDKAFRRSNNRSYTLLEDLLNDIILEAGLDFSFDIPEPSLEEFVWVTEYIYEEEEIDESEPEIEPDFIRPPITVPSVENIPVYAKPRGPDSPSLFNRKKAEEKQMEIEVESETDTPDYIHVRLTPKPKSKDGTSEGEIDSEESKRRDRRKLRKAVEYTDSELDSMNLEIEEKKKPVSGWFSMSLKGKDQVVSVEDTEVDDSDLKKFNEQSSVHASSLPIVEKSVETTLLDKKANERYISERPIISIQNEEEISVPEEQKKEQDKRGFYDFLSLKPEAGKHNKKEKKYKSTEESSDPLLISQDCIERRIDDLAKQDHFLKGFSDSSNNLKEHQDDPDSLANSENSLLIDDDSIRHRIDNASQKTTPPGGFALVFKNKKLPLTEETTANDSDAEINIPAPKDNSMLSEMKAEVDNLKSKKLSQNEDTPKDNPIAKENFVLSGIGTALDKLRKKKPVSTEDISQNNRDTETSIPASKENSVLLRIEKEVEKWCKENGIDDIYSEVTEIEKKIESISDSISFQEDIFNIDGLTSWSDRNFTHELLKLDEFLETVFLQESDTEKNDKNNKKSETFERQEGLIIGRLLKRWFQKRSRSKSSWNEIYENSLRRLKDNKGLLNEWLTEKVATANAEKQEIKKWIQGQVSSSSGLFDIFKEVVEQTESTDMADIMGAVQQKISKKDLPNQTVVDVFKRIKEEVDPKPFEFRDLDRILNKWNLSGQYKISEKVSSGYSISSYRDWNNFIESPDIKVRTSSSNKTPYLLDAGNSVRAREFLESPDIKVRTSSDYFSHYLMINSKKIKNENFEIKIQPDKYAESLNLSDIKKVSKQREFLESPTITVRTSNESTKHYALIDNNKITDWRESQCYIYFDDVKI